MAMKAKLQLSCVYCELLYHSLGWGCATRLWAVVSDTADRCCSLLEDRILQPPQKQTCLMKAQLAPCRTCQTNWHAHTDSPPKYTARHAQNYTVHNNNICIFKWSILNKLDTHSRHTVFNVRLCTRKEMVAALMGAFSYCTILLVPWSTHCNAKVPYQQTLWYGSVWVWRGGVG